MIIAFSTWNGRIAPVFDIAKELIVVDDAERERVCDAFMQISCASPLDVIPKLVEFGVGALVCGAISRPFHEMIAAHGVQLIPFIAGDVDEVIAAWRRGDLRNDAFAMPGCCGGRGRRGSGRRMRRGQDESQHKHRANQRRS